MNTCHVRTLHPQFFTCWKTFTIEKITVISTIKVRNCRPNMTWSAFRSHADQTDEMVRIYVKLLTSKSAKQDSVYGATVFGEVPTRSNNFVTGIKT